MAIRLLLGLGSISLWPLALASELRMGVAAGPSLGAGMGDLEI